MSKVTTATKYPEVKNIKQDLTSLKQHASELTEHVKEDGAKQAEEIKEYAAERFSEFKDSTQKQIEAVEGYVQKKPVQAVAIAFGAGLIASLLLGRR